MGVGSDYYDYGPAKPVKGLETVPGSRWWDDPGKFPELQGDTGETNLDDVLGKIENVAHDLDVFSIPICVCAPEAKAVREWWEAKYAKLGNYNVIGAQCTTTVKDSLNQGLNKCFVHKVSGLVKKPITYLKNLKGVRHGCGSNKGKLVRIYHIYKGGQNVH